MKLVYLVIESYDNIFVITHIQIFNDLDIYLYFKKYCTLKENIMIKYQLVFDLYEILWIWFTWPELLI
jgi:hypothetical protein